MVLGGRGFWRYFSVEKREPFEIVLKNRDFYVNFARLKTNVC